MHFGKKILRGLYALYSYSSLLRSRPEKVSSVKCLLEKCGLQYIIWSTSKKMACILFVSTVGFYVLKENMISNTKR